MKLLLEAAEVRGDRTLAMLQRWVAQNSHSAVIANVNAMGGLLQEAFDLPGLALEVRSGDGVGDHLMWRTPAWDAAAGGRVLLVGHHDTVFPPGEFEGWQRDGDRIGGPGTLDMKGGLAVVHTALATLAEAGKLADLPLALVSVADEEIGSPDSRTFVEQHARGAACALVFEAGRDHDAIITRRKGTGAVLVAVTGKAAHAGNHHADGVNAIWALARLVEAVQGLTDYGRGITVNVGLISGGSSRNTVPGHAECQIDFRFEQIERGQELVAAFDAAARRAAGDTGARFELTGGVRRPPLEKTQASQALYERYAACAQASGLGDVEASLLGGGSDANNIAALGVPCIDGLGPRGHGFHTHDEYIEASSLPLRAAALLRFLCG